jgi:hypothetical protein
MIRRSLALFLITALILNQAAFALAHVHEGEGDSAPHIHLPWESHAALGHSHSAQSHNHSHDHSHSHHHDVPADCETDCVDCDSHSDEQHEAVVFVHHDAFIASGSRCMIAAFCVSMLTSCSTTEILVHTGTEYQSSKRFLDAPARTTRAIYLQTRSLRL